MISLKRCLKCLKEKAIQYGCVLKPSNRKLDMIPTCAYGNLDSIPKTHFLEQIASIFKKNNIQQTQTKVLGFAEEVHILMATLHATLKWGCTRAIFFFHHLSGENMHEGNFEWRSGLQMQKTAN